MNKISIRVSFFVSGIILSVLGVVSLSSQTYAYTTGQTFFDGQGKYSTSKSPYFTFSVPSSCSDVRFELRNDAGFYRYFDSNSSNTGSVRKDSRYPSLNYTFSLDLGASYNNVVLANGKYHVAIMSACGSPSGYSNPTYFDQHLDAFSIFPTACNDPATNTSYCAPLHRFYNVQNGAHFYTADESEKRQVMAYPQFRYEGITAFVQKQNSTSGNVTVWRFYNKYTGTHFYTAVESEANNVYNNQWQTYNYEGPQYTAYPTQQASTAPFYRFYKFKQGVHFYTSSYAEYQNVVNTMSGEYRYEGVAYYNIINQ